MSTSWKAAVLFCLFLLGAAAARAHDALQSSTSLWLRPDSMEVDIVMSRVPSRSLIDNAPDVPVTVDNFDGTYRLLFKKAVPQMIGVSVDGRPLAPTTWDADLFEETDVKFTLTYPRPPGGKLRVTGDFIKRMGEGYINSLDMNEDKKVLGIGNQTAENPVWEIFLGPIPVAKPPAPASMAANPGLQPQDTYFIIPHFGWLAICASVALIILLAIWFFRQKS